MANMTKILACVAFVFSAVTLFGQERKVASDPDSFSGRIWVVRPGQSYLRVLEKLMPGDELVLHEGVYPGNAIINSSGSPDKPITIRGYGHGEKRPVLLWVGADAILLQVNGSNIVFDYLELRSKYTYCMRMGGSGKGNSNVIVKNSVFFECGGGCISANAPVKYDHISISDNYFIGPKKTPVYIGQHAGKAAVDHFTFNGNVIDGSQIYGGSIVGYGIELKLNVVNSLIENNYITNTKGPGIMVYGAVGSGGEQTNIVRNNIVVGSRNDAGIVVGGGPSTVANNLVLGCLGGIEVMNYGGRNLLKGVSLKNNTLVCNRNYGMSLADNPDVVAENNFVISLDTSRAFIKTAQYPLQKNTYHSELAKSLQTIIDDKLMNVFPAPNNLEKIWLRVSSGPLSQSDVFEALDVILEYKIPVQILNDKNPD
jgi:hypothetical protein